jgi:MFS family permease
MADGAGDGASTAPAAAVEMAAARPPSLWRHADFNWFWAAETASVVGSQVTMLALPLTAALLLQATPVQMGVLVAAETLPFLLVGLPAGAWVDRRRRRPVLIAADIGRALVLLAVPLAWLQGWLRIEVLVVVGFLTGLLTVFFDVAYQAYLPALVDRRHLVEGNSRLELSRSAAQIVGPGLAGGLVQLAGGPLAIVVDAVSFAVSAVCLGRIRRLEPDPPLGTAGSLWREIGEGLRLVVGNPVLRGIAGSTATWNLFGNIAQTVLVLFATRELGLNAGWLGLVFAIAGVGALVGALLAGPVAGRAGVGPTIIGAQVVGAASWLLLPLAGAGSALSQLGVALAIGSAASTIYNITQVSLRQTITPDHLQGRMNATMRVIVWGTLPLGALIGGLLGEWLGLRPTLWIGAAGALLAGLWLWYSPLRTVAYGRQRARPAP